MCKVCGRPLVSAVSITCGNCLEEQPGFEWVRSYGLYDGTLKLAINLLKYHQKKRLARPLAELLFQKNNGNPWSAVRLPDTFVIIPVPLFKKKMKQREFNQSALLAKHFAGHTGSKLLLNCLTKIKETVPQVMLSAKERNKNVRKAFRITGENVISSKNVVLFDDVFTTGATLRECSKILRKAGARKIYGITLAHSRGDF
jgi:ComF family protein